MIRYVRSERPQDGPVDTFHLTILLRMVSGSVYIVHVRDPTNVLEELLHEYFRFLRSDETVVHIGRYNYGRTVRTTLRKIWLWPGWF